MAAWTHAIGRAVGATMARTMTSKSAAQNGFEWVAMASFLMARYAALHCDVVGILKCNDHEFPALLPRDLLASDL